MRERVLRAFALEEPGALASFSRASPTVDEGGDRLETSGMTNKAWLRADHDRQRYVALTEGKREDPSPTGHPGPLVGNDFVYVTVTDREPRQSLRSVERLQRSRRPVGDLLASLPSEAALSHDADRRARRYRFRLRAVA
jgi:hypothetical protein